MALQETGLKYVSIGIDQFISAANNATKQVNGFGSSLQTAASKGPKVDGLREIAVGAFRAIGAAAVDLAAKGIQSFISNVGDMISGARESNGIMAQTEAVIKSTGGAAEVSAKHVADYASSISAASGKSLFGDEAIQSSTNMLLTFTNIKGEVLDLATAMSVDMAQAFKKSPEDMSVMIGKLLNSADAMSAAKRMGVAFTDQQMKLGKEMFKSGNIAGYQKLVLEELNKEFGGSAAAAAKADGGWAQFNDRMDEAKETIGKALLPLLQPLGDLLNNTIAPAIETVANGFSAWLGDPSTQESLKQIAATISQDLSVAMDFIANTAIPALVNAWSAVEPTFSTVANIVSANLGPILVGLGAMILTVVVPAFVAWAAAAIASATATIVALAPVLVPIALIGAAAALLYAAWQSNFGGIQEKTQAAWSFVQPIFITLGNWLSGILSQAVQTLAGFWSNTLWPALQKVWSFIDTSIIPIFGAIANVWIALLKKEVELLAALWSNVLWPALKKVGDFIGDTVIPAFDDAASAVSDTLGPALEWLDKNVLGPVTAAFSHIGDAVQDVINFLKRLADSINAIEIPSWLQGHSPPPAANWFSSIGDAISEVLEVLNLLPSAFSGVEGVTEALAKQLDDLAKKASDFVEKLQQGILTGNISGLGETIDNLKFVRSLLKDAAAAGDDLASAAEDYNKALLKGDEDAAFAAKKRMDEAKEQQGIMTSIANRSEQDLARARAEFLKNAKTDPANAAVLFDLRSKHIQDLARLDIEISKEKDARALQSLMVQREFLIQQQGLEVELAKRKAEQRQKDIEDQAKAIAKAISDAFDKITIVGDMSKAIQQLYNVMVKLAHLDLGSWQPGSPTPFELGLRGINTEVQKLTKFTMPALARVGAPAGSSQIYSSTSTYAPVYSPQYNLGVQTNNSPAAVQQSFEIMKSLVGR